MAAEISNKKIDALAPNPVVTGTIALKEADVLSVKVGKTLVEIPTASIVEQSKRGDLDIITIRRNAKIVISSLIEVGRDITVSDIFVELVKGGLVACNCNCNCNCGDSSNCNCNCNCDDMPAEFGSPTRVVARLGARRFRLPARKP